MKNKKKLKVLVLTSSFPKSKNDGVINFVKNQLLALKKYNQNLDFFVLTPNFYSKYKEDVNSDYKILRYRYFIKKYELINDKGIMTSLRSNYLLTFLLIPYFFSQIFNAIKILKSYKPDIVYAHWITFQGITALVLFKVFKIPYVITTHAHDGTILLKIPILGKFLLKQIIRNSKSWTADSEVTKKLTLNAIGNDNSSKSKSMVAPMFFDSDNYDIFEENKYPNNFQLNNKYINILFVGRFTKKKGLEEFLELFSDEFKELKSLRLYIAGDGPLKKKYLKLIEKLGLSEYVKFTGYLNTQQKKYFYSNCNLVVIPSVITRLGDREGLPTVLLEAMYNGSITFSSLGSNADELITDGLNGFLFDYDDIDGSKEKLRSILQLDKIELEKISESAKERVESYKTKNITKLFYNHLFKIA
jgi:glycosyltransferase involved in cell wall biosynthesis